MGAWDEDSFGNDMACDWGHELENSTGLYLIETTIDRVLQEGETLGPDLACEGIAACDVVARLQGRFGQQDAYTTGIDGWVRSNPTEVSLSLIQRAKEALDVIMSERSELRELWSEGPSDSGWMKLMHGLRSRVLGF